MRFLGPLPPLLETVRRSLVEFIGTFAFVFIGAGAVIQLSGAADNTLTIALAHGLVFAVMISAVAHISGGHFNPAITFAFLVTRRISILLGLVYVIVQMGAAALAALLLKWIFPSAMEAALGAPSLSIDTGPALVVEALLTFFLVWVVVAMTADLRSTYTAIAGLAIGLTVTFDMLFGGPLTGGMMNPARAFGPQLVANSWSGLGEFWIWYVGPLAGGAIAALLYDELYLRPAQPGPVGSSETSDMQRSADVAPPPPPPPPGS